MNLFEFIFGHNMQRHLPHLHHLIQLLAAKVRIKGMGGEERRGSERRKGFNIFQSKGGVIAAAVIVPFVALLVGVAIVVAVVICIYKRR